jgi:hypothetical protein
MTDLKSRNEFPDSEYLNGDFTQFAFKQVNLRNLMVIRRDFNVRPGIHFYAKIRLKAYLRLLLYI